MEPPIYIYIYISIFSIRKSSKEQWQVWRASCNDSGATVALKETQLAADFW